jgi:hypothetical protein
MKILIFDHILAGASDELRALDVIRAAFATPAADAPLPAEIVWMPAGTHEISAYNAANEIWKGTVICDQAGAQLVQASYERIRASGKKVRLDEAHKGAGATAWVQGFSWDPSRGIIAAVEWTSLGEQLVRGKVYTSFSPEFAVNKQTKRVSAIWPNFPAGGLVNEPAFGAAMPALIAARLAGAESSANPAPDGSSGNQNNRTMKDLLIQILAALAVSHPADATEEQLTGLVAKNTDRLKAAASDNAHLKTQLAEYETLKAQLADYETLKAEAVKRIKADADVAVKAAVARGAIPIKDEKIQAQWRGLIESNAAHIELLNALPGNPALKPVTTPDIQVQDGLLESIRAYSSETNSKKRGHIYARHIDAAITKIGNEILHVMAANSLGTLSSAIILQRYLSLLKFQFPFLRAITTDFSDAAVSFGQDVTTRLRSVPTVRDYNATTGYTTRSDAGSSDVKININKHKYASIEFTATELGSTSRDLFGEQSEPQLYALGYQLVSDLLALIVEGASAFGTAGSQATVVANAAAFSIGTLDTIAGVMGDRKISPMGRFVLLDTSLFTPLRGDTRLVYLAGFQDRSIIEEYKLPKISEFQPYYAPFMPTGVAVNTSKVLHGFAGTPESLALATRLPSDYAAVLPGAANGRVTTITEPDLNLSVALVQYVNHDLGSAIQRVALQYGGAIGNPATGQLIAY